MNSLRATTVIAALVLALAACASDSNSAGSTAAPQTSATSASTPTSSASTSATTATSDSSVSTDNTNGSTDESTNGTESVNQRIDQAQQALEDGNFSAMLQALELSGVATDINNRAITILAPTDQAFTNVSADVARDLATNPTKIDDIIRRHILDGTYTFDELKKQTSVKTISGETLDVSTKGDTLTIDGAVVTDPKNPKFDGSNGQEVALYEIDTVLVGP